MRTPVESWEREMRDRLEAKNQIIEKLNEENAALRNYYEAVEEWRGYIGRWQCTERPDEETWQRITGAVDDAAYLVSKYEESQS